MPYPMKLKSNTKQYPIIPYKAKINLGEYNRVIDKGGFDLDRHVSLPNILLENDKHEDTDYDIDEEADFVATLNGNANSKKR